MTNHLFWPFLSVFKRCRDSLTNKAVTVICGTLLSPVVNS